MSQETSLAGWDGLASSRTRSAQVLLTRPSCCALANGRVCITARIEPRICAHPSAQTPVKRPVRKLAHLAKPGSIYVSTSCEKLSFPVYSSMLVFHGQTKSADIRMKARKNSCESFGSPRAGTIADSFAK